MEHRLTGDDSDQSQGREAACDGEVSISTEECDIERDAALQRARGDAAVREATKSESDAGHVVAASSFTESSSDLNPEEATAALAHVLGPMHTFAQAAKCRPSKGRSAVRLERP